jgi:hypothetical protein
VSLDGDFEMDGYVVIADRHFVDYQAHQRLLLVKRELLQTRPDVRREYR